MANSYKLKAGQTLTVTVQEGRAHVRCLVAGVSAFTRSSLSFGPYLVDTDWLVDGDASAVIADHLVAANALLFENDGAPEDAVQASATINPTGDDNSLIFTAREYGAGGNAITVAYVDPGADSALSVSVFRQAITVTLAYSSSAITSTAAEVLAAIAAHGVANELVTVALDEADTNFSDGSGVVTAIAMTALEGGEGTGIGIAKPGGLCVDTANADTYRNDGTTAAPVWVKLGDAA